MQTDNAVMAVDSRARSGIQVVRWEAITVQTTILRSRLQGPPRLVGEQHYVMVVEYLGSVGKIYLKLPVTKDVTPVVVLQIQFAATFRCQARNRQIQNVIFRYPAVPWGQAAMSGAV